MIKIGKINSKTVKYLFDEGKFFFILLGKLEIVEEENCKSLSNHGLVKYFMCHFHFRFFQRIADFHQLIIFDE